jgi:hypothetical protein
MKERRSIAKGAKALTGCFLISLLVSVSPLVIIDQCRADNAEVLPQGRSAIFIEGKLYFPVDERYGPDGHEEDVAADFNTNLDSSLFPLPPGGSFGRSVVSFEYEFTIIEFNYAYGITDKLSLGIKIPYWDVENKVEATLDTTNYTIGKNPFVPGGFAPRGVPGTQPLTATDIQNLLVRNYGIDPIKSWSRSGISDVEGLLRYQYYKSENWRLAVTGGIRFPTGREDDPDSLVDYPFGTGAWAGLFRVHSDYIGTKNLMLSATLKYDLYLPDHKVMRIPDDINQPLTRNKEKVDRDIGDFFELEMSGTYEFWKGLSCYLVYKVGYKWRDDISGDMGYAYDVAESETNAKEHVYIIGLQYSTISSYLAKEFPLPIVGSIGYRNRFAGENVLKSEYIDILLTVYF